MKQSLKNHLRVSTFTWSLTIIYVIGWWYFHFDLNYLKAVGIFHLINTIPALYLHIEYMVANWNQAITIRDSGIDVLRNGVLQRYAKSDVQKIIVVKAASQDKGGIKLTAIESYYYARLMMQNGNEIIITCLLASSIENELSQLRDVPVERIKKIFCSIDPI
jgi:hypothetical protein